MLRQRTFSLSAFYYYLVVLFALSFCTLRHNSTVQKGHHENQRSDPSVLRFAVPKTGYQFSSPIEIPLHNHNHGHGFQTRFVITTTPAWLDIFDLDWQLLRTRYTYHWGTDTPCLSLTTTVRARAQARTRTLSATSSPHFPSETICATVPNPQPDHPLSNHPDDVFRQLLQTTAHHGADSWHRRQLDDPSWRP